MNFSTIKIMFLVPIFLLFVGCGEGSSKSDDNPTPDTVAPTVSSANLVDDAITIVFSEAMDSSSITTTNITLVSGDTNITSTVSYSGTTATLTPSDTLEHSTAYTIKVSTNVKDTSGNTLVLEYSSSFTTAILSTVTTIAGSGIAGNTDANGANARFNKPQGIAIDSDGNLFVSDQNNHIIKKITPSADVITFAGSTQGDTDANGTASKFYNPRGIIVDSDGNLFVADTWNHKIRKITPSGVVSTVAGTGTAGSANSATIVDPSFNHPMGITIDKNNNLFIADSNNHKIRKITPSGVVTSFAGSDTNGSTDGTSASFYNPRGITIDSDGNLFVADSSNNKIRKITPSGVVSTVAGSGAKGNTDGTSTDASFNFPTGITIDSDDNLFVADYGNHIIRKITPSGTVTTIAGTGTIGITDDTSTNASFNYPMAIAADSYGNLFVVDQNNHKIRKIELSDIVTNITASNDTVNNQIDISWSAVSNASYKIYRATSKDGNYTSVGTSTTTSYSDIAGGISASTPYYYKVTSIINENESSLSDTKSDAGYFIDGTGKELVL